MQDKKQFTKQEMTNAKFADNKIISSKQGRKQREEIALKQNIARRKQQQKARSIKK